MLCVSAGLHALRRVLGSRSALSDVQVMDRVKVMTSDLKLAMTEVKPSAMREVAIDVPKVQQLITRLTNQRSESLTDRLTGQSQLSMYSLKRHTEQIHSLAQL